VGIENVSDLLEDLQKGFYAIEQQRKSQVLLKAVR
jgi:hypothetical protein